MEVRHVKRSNYFCLDDQDEKQVRLQQQPLLFTLSVSQNLVNCLHSKHFISIFCTFLDRIFGHQIVKRAKKRCTRQ